MPLEPCWAWRCGPFEGPTGTALAGRKHLVGRLRRPAWFRFGAAEIPCGVDLSPPRLPGRRRPSVGPASCRAVAEAASAQAFKDALARRSTTPRSTRSKPTRCRRRRCPKSRQAGKKKIREVRHNRACREVCAPAWRRRCRFGWPLRRAVLLVLLLRRNRSGQVCRAGSDDAGSVVGRSAGRSASYAAIWSTWVSEMPMSSKPSSRRQRV